MRAKPTSTSMALFLAASLLAWTPAVPAADREAQVPAGARFVVELRDKLDAEKVKPGKRFEARLDEALQGDDGSVIEAGRRLRGRVSYAKDTRLLLRFEEIDTGHGWVPIVATVTQVLGEKNVKESASSEGEISSTGGRGKGAAIGAVVGAGIGAAVGAARAGGKGAAIGAGAGGAGGALIGAAAGRHDLVLLKGARLELTLDRPLAFRSNRS